MKRMKRMTEHELQTTIIAWAREYEPEAPELGLLYAIPNGSRRDIGVAVKLKKEGVLRGIPDLCLPVARHGYHALYVEVKLPTGKLSLYQKDVIEALKVCGNKCVVVRSTEEAIRELISYLNES